MTSRIVKTYSRKAGDGTSKFDEVLSNKRATLSTKWGETTYKAQLGSKRPGMKAERPDRTKKPKMAEDDCSEDPFGFDSDDESKPVSSRNSSKSSPAKTGSGEAGLTLEPNSRVNLPVSVEAAMPGRPPARSSSTPSGEKSTVRLPEDSGKFFSSSTSGMETLQDAVLRLEVCRIDHLHALQSSIQVSERQQHCMKNKTLIIFLIITPLPSASFLFSLDSDTVTQPATCINKQNRAS